MLSSCAKPNSSRRGSCFYVPPALVCFGKISALTAGGSGRFQENVRFPMGMGMGMGMMGMIMGCVPMRNPPPGDPCNLP